MYYRNNYQNNLSERRWLTREYRIPIDVLLLFLLLLVYSECARSVNTLSRLILFVYSFVCISIFCHFKLFTQLIKRNINVICQCRYPNGKVLRAWLLLTIIKGRLIETH